MAKRIVKRCPKCGGDEFDVTAHVTQGWIVDEDGQFVSCTRECEEVTHTPDDDDLWTCHKCGYNAAGREFNVELKEPEVPYDAPW